MTFPPISSYLGLLTSQYQGSTRLLNWLTAALSPLNDASACLASFDAAFNLSTAVGPQLDILGELIGQARTVGFQPSNGVSPKLDDTTYRLLLQARVAQNSWNGSIDSLQGIWKSLFPGGNITVQDGQNMTATVILSGAFTSIVEDLINNGP